MKQGLMISLLIFMLMHNYIAYAQDKTATIRLSFERGDSVNTCKARVTSDDSVVAGVSVALFVERLYGLLPIGRSVSTGADGIAVFYLPVDIPVGQDGRMTVIARIEDDENYANAETKVATDLGKPRPERDSLFMQRALWASGNKAPVFLIASYSLTVLAVWATLIYVVLQMFKIRRLRKKLIPEKV